MQAKALRYRFEQLCGVHRYYCMVETSGGLRKDAQLISLTIGSVGIMLM